MNRSINLGCNQTRNYKALLCCVGGNKMSRDSFKEHCWLLLQTWQLPCLFFFLLETFSVNALPDNLNSHQKSIRRVACRAAASFALCPLFVCQEQLIDTGQLIAHLLIKEPQGTVFIFYIYFYCRQIFCDSKASHLQVSFTKHGGLHLLVVSTGQPD